FDAYAFDVRTKPVQAYAFAQGAPVSLPPLDATGTGTQTIQIDRSLDFTAVTDHSEFLGEVELCITPGSPAYDSNDCLRGAFGRLPEAPRRVSNGELGCGLHREVAPPVLEEVPTQEKRDGTRVVERHSREPVPVAGVPPHEIDRGARCPPGGIP